jgi:hypothetical protein
LNYNVYIDDGLDGDFTGPIDNGLSLTWSKSGLISGRIYKIKYSSTNVHGESELSNEVSILLAEKPSAPDGLQRININEISAGEVRLGWSLPTDEGGDPVLGYKLYLNDILWEDQSKLSTLNNYTYSGLTVGTTYDFSVTAINDIGESPASKLSLVASSPPSKTSSPTWVASTPTSVTIEAPTPSFDGGSEILNYVFTRDNGPLTAYTAQVVQVESQY